MAKRSVYIPDSLWEEIQAHVHDLNLSVSEIVQTALKQVFVKQRGAAAAGSHLPFARPAIDPGVLEKLRRRFQKEAQASYDDGVRAGTLLAEKLSWRQMNKL